MAANSPSRDLSHRPEFTLGPPSDSRPLRTDLPLSGIPNGAGGVNAKGNFSAKPVRHGGLDPTGPSVRNLPSAAFHM
jgi:hypothetical protein